MPPGARSRFKTVAVRDPDPIKFAKKHEDALNSFMADGWNVTGMMNKGDALIITGQRLEMGPPPPEQEAPPDEPGFSLPQSSTDDGHVEIVYSFIERGTHRSVSCVSMPDAMNQVRAHLSTGGDVLPNRITVMSLMSYEPIKDLPVLNRLYPPIR